VDLRVQALHAVVVVVAMLFAVLPLLYTRLLLCA
jgi:hypothetical protein